jgi:glycine hydroxymethyltransferase
MIMADDAHGAAVDKTLFPGLQGGPLMHVIAAKAVAFGEVLEPAFTEYIRGVLANASTLADALQEHGLRVISGGTDNHLMLVDLREFGVSGRKIQRVLEEAGMTTNRNSVPNDPRSPFQTSGVRLGSAAVTTRGFDRQEMRQIGRWIAELVHDPDNRQLIERTREQAVGLSRAFPLPGVGAEVGVD